MFGQKKQLSQEEFTKMIESKEYSDLREKGMEHEKAIELLTKAKQSAGITEKQTQQPPETYFQKMEKQNNPKKYWK